MRSLEEIDHSIADRKRRVKEQHRRISDMVRRGDDATASAVLLETFTQFLAVLEYRRETLLLLAGDELLRQRRCSAERVADPRVGWEDI